MPRKIQLSIPEPCHEDWNAMTPAGNRRFCSSCSKEVIDFSGMSDAQLIRFFKEPRGSVCGRFQQEQLANELVIPPKRVPWLRYFFTISLPAFLFSCKSNRLTGEMAIKTELVKATTGLLVMETERNDPSLAKSEPLISARDTTSSLANVPLPKTRTITVKQNNTQALSLACPPEIMGDTILTKTLEEIVVQPYPPTVTDLLMAGGISYKVIQTTFLDTIKATVKRLSDSLASSIRLYPNPLLSGQAAKIDWNGSKPGTYQMQLVNMSGQVVYTGKVTVNSKSDLLTIHLPPHKPGAYVLSFQNTKAFLTYSHKLIIR